MTTAASPPSPSDSDLLRYPPGATVPFEVFHRHFTATGTERIRVDFDWSRLQRLIKTRAAAIRRHDDRPDAAQLAALLTPWFVYPDGGKAPWLAPGGKLLTLEQAMSHPWKKGSARSPQRVHRDIVALSAPEPAERPPIVIATLALGARRLILDGSHRLLSLLRLPATCNRAVVAEFRVETAVDDAASLLDRGPELVARYV
ncbi:MAG: hypothetical protein ABF811_01715 [Pseudoclavibacter sp.]|jgi:hypothetical protein